MVVFKHNISLFKSNSQIPIIKVYLNYLLFNIEPVIMFKFMCSTILVLHLVSNNNGEIDKKKIEDHRHHMTSTFCDSTSKHGDFNLL